MSSGCPELDDDLWVITSELATERAWLTNCCCREKAARREAKVAAERIHALLLQQSRIERALEECVSRGYGWRRRWASRTP